MAAHAAIAVIAVIFVRIMFAVPSDLVLAVATRKTPPRIRCDSW
jgi:hypothetical protein